MIMTFKEPIETSKQTDIYHFDAKHEISNLSERYISLISVRNNTFPLQKKTTTPE